MNLDDFRKTNVARCRDFGHAVEEWPVERWALAVAGETGELCNLIKKQVRGDDVKPEEIADEIADVFTYLDLLAAKLGLDMSEIVASKFNRVSERIRSDFVIDPPLTSGKEGKEAFIRLGLTAKEMESLVSRLCALETACSFAGLIEKQCRCGHPHSKHEHTEKPCSLCDDCRGYEFERWQATGKTVLSPDDVDQSPVLRRTRR